MAAAAIGLQAGLSQTDWFGFGTGVLGTGLAAAAYNQAAYLSSVALRQCQLYQKKNYDISWVSVARDDIRNMMEISVTRISNYMMVSTLIIGIATDALLGINFPDDCPSYVQTAFWINMSLSILFFTESIMFAVKGQNSAFINTMRLLTWELRPENPAAYDHDYMQQMNIFEHSSLAQLFRLPGLQSRFGGDDRSNGGGGGKKDPGRKRSPKKGRDSDGGIGDLFGGLFGGDRRPTHDPSAGSSTDPRRGASPRRGSPGRGSGFQGGPGTPQEELEHVVPETRMLLYLARFGHFMQLWQPYDTSSKYCIGLGLVALAHGAAYFCIGHLAQSSMYMANYIAVITVAIFIAVTIMIYEQNLHTRHSLSRYTVYVLIGLAPVVAVIGNLSRDNLTREWLAAAAFFCHAVHYAIGWIVSVFEFRKPWDVTKKFTTGPRGQQFPERWMELIEGNSAVDDGAGDVPPGGRAREVRGGDFRKGTRARPGGDEEDVFSDDSSSGDERSATVDGGFGGNLGSANTGAFLAGDASCNVRRPGAAERRKVIETSNRVLGIVRSSILFAALVWLATFVASIITGFESLGLWFAHFTKTGPMDPVLEGGEVVEIQSPAPGLQLKSLACRNGQMFGANRFQVFRVNTSTGVISSFHCPLEREILDLALACLDDGEGECRPIVLLDDATLFDCASESSTPLLKGISAKRIALADAMLGGATGAGDSPAGDGAAGPRLLASDNGTLIECLWQPGAGAATNGASGAVGSGGWAPQWAFSNASVPRTVSIDWAANRIFQFWFDLPARGFVYRNGLSVLRPSDLQTLGTWRLSDNDFTNLAGCAMSERIVFFVQLDDASTRLLRVELPS